VRRREHGVDASIHGLALELTASFRYQGDRAMPQGQALLDALARELSQTGIDPRAWLLSWARLLPSVVLIPAFGLRALPVFARALFAFVLASSVAPALAPWAATERHWLLVLGAQVSAGVPVATSAALTIWVATMAGGLIDEARSGRLLQTEFESVDSAASPLGVLLSLGASVAFLSLGGPARLTEALASAEPISRASLEGVARALADGCQVAVLIAAPLLLAVAFLEVFRALLSRISNQLLSTSLLAGLRPLALLAIVALLLDRLVEGLVLWMNAKLPPG